MAADLHLAALENVVGMVDGPSSEPGDASLDLVQVG